MTPFMWNPRTSKINLWWWKSESDKIERDKRVQTLSGTLSASYMSVYSRKNYWTEPSDECPFLKCWLLFKNHFVFFIVIRTDHMRQLSISTVFKHPVLNCRLCVVQSANSRLKVVQQSSELWNSLILHNWKFIPLEQWVPISSSPSPGTPVLLPVL